MSAAAPDRTVITLRLSAPAGADPEAIADTVRRALRPVGAELVLDGMSREPAGGIAASRWAAFLEGFGSILALLSRRRSRPAPSDQDALRADWEALAADWQAVVGRAVPGGRR